MEWLTVDKRSVFTLTILDLVLSAVALDASVEAGHLPIW